MSCRETPRLCSRVEVKQEKCRRSFSATHTLIPLAMSTCGEAGSDVHALIKELAIRRVEHRPEIHSNESRYVAERTEVARLGGGSLLVYRRHFHFARDIISADREWRLWAPNSSIRKTWFLFMRIAPRG